MGSRGLTTHAETAATPRLEGQTAIVTGAGRGIGRAVALELGREGVAVALAARSAGEIEEVAAAVVEAGGKAIAVPTDVTDEQAVASLVTTVGQALGPATLLVNNAGSMAEIGPVAEAEPTSWWRDVEVNLKGTFLCTRAVLPSMLKTNTGRVINVSSYTAVSARPFMTAYACAKAAVLRFTDSLDAELQATAVRAFCVTPGFVRTQLVERAADSVEGRRYVPDLRTRQDGLAPERAARLVAEIATGRLDRLSGRFLHVLDEVDDLLRRADEIQANDLYLLRIATLSN